MFIYLVYHLLIILYIIVFNHYFILFIFIYQLKLNYVMLQIIKYYLFVIFHELIINYIWDKIYVIHCCIMGRSNVNMGIF